MDFKKIIQKIHQQNSTYKFPEQAENLANSLETISDDIYSESDRFVFELIQNADDAYVEGQKELEVVIEFASPFIVISHTGKEFSESDIKSITSVGNSVKAKNKKQIGYKGIGFKSVFSKSKCVYIASSGFCFRFDESYWKDRKVPWQIIPIWSKGELPIELKDTNFGHYPVSTAIKLEKDEFQKTRKVIYEIFEKLEVLLFLRNITKVKVENKLVIEKKNEAIESCPKILSETKFKVLQTSLFVNNRLKGKWIVGHCEEIEIDKYVQNSLKGNPKVPSRLVKAKFTGISFAGKVDEKDQIIIPDDKSLIFVYLPTKIATQIPFLVNADFLTNASREGFHEDLVWNHWLFEKVGYKSIEWLKVLAKTKYKYSIGCIIPGFFANKDNALHNSFNKGLSKGLKEIRFIPGREGHLLRCDEAIEEKLGIEDLFNIELVVHWYNSRIDKSITVGSFIDKNLRKNKRFHELKIRQFGLSALGEFIQFLYNRGKFGLDESIDTIKFLYRCYSKFSENIDVNTLKKVAFLLNQELNLCKPESTCFPSEDFLAHNKDIEVGYHVLHKDLFMFCERESSIKNWLEKLGIEKLNESFWVNKVLIPKLKEQSNIDNLIKNMRLLFKKRRFIDDSVDLGNIFLVTTSNQLKKAKDCYLSDYYLPKCPIQSLLDLQEDEDFFVSKAYVDSENNKIKWRDFFTEVIGVSDRISPKDKEHIAPNSGRFSRLYRVGSACGKIDEKYDTYINNEASRINSDLKDNPPVFELYKLKFLEFASKNVAFAQMFWRSLLNEFKENKYAISDFFLPCKPKLGLGIEKGYHEILHYNEWAIKNLPLFPTKDGSLRRASEVIVGSEFLYKIGGQELPLLDLGEDFELPQEVQNDSEVFNFRKNVTLSEYLEILDKLSETGKLVRGNIDLVSKRIGLIYSELVKYVDSTEKKVIQEWGERGKLLSVENKFVSVSSLYYLHVNGLSINRDFGLSVKSLGRLSKEEEIALFRTFGVKIITDEFVKPRFENIVEETYLRTEILRKLSLIALVVSKKEEKDFDNVLDILRSKVEATFFYRVNRIDLCVFDEHGGILHKISVKGLLWCENIYYAGDWKKPVVMYDLTNALSKFFSKKEISKELYVLLLSSVEEGREWLDSQGFDTSILPNYTTNKSQERQSKFVDNRTEEQKLSSEYRGEKAEGFVFMELVKFYKNKYSEAQILVEDDVCFETDRVKVIWYAKMVDKHADHDILIEEDGKRKFVEVKSTIEGAENNCDLYFSYPEWDLMCKNPGKYFVARVFNNENPSEVTFVKMQVVDYPGEER